MPGILLLTCGLVFTAELVGDKLLYTMGALALRYRPGPMAVGVMIAFMAKMGVAVLAGRALTALPARLIAALSAVTFFAMAYVLWRKKLGPWDAVPQDAGSAWRAVLIPFAGVFFSEWADIGQITAATLSAEYHAPLAVWCGATIGMCAKGILAITLGARVRRYLPVPVMRYCGVGLLAVMGVLAALRVE